MKRSITTLSIAFGLAIACAGVAIAGSSPAVSTGSATKITNTSAVLGGTVNPAGTHTSYQFEYGLTKAYGVLTKVGSAGSGKSAAAVTSAVSKLIPGTTYHYRLLATNKYGTSSGSDRTFKTTGHPPPSATTGPPSQVHQFAVTLTGTINPNGQATSYEFQYGLTTSYGLDTSAGILLASGAPSVVTGVIDGLEPGTLFHYRLIALHGTSVISVGADGTFFTLPHPAPKPRVTGSTTPHRSSRAPFVLTTRATVRGPASIPASYACFGNAEITYSVGKRQVGFTLASLLGNCTLSASTTFTRMPVRLKHGQRSETVKIVVHFRGNGYLAPAFARTEKVTLG